jgi:hypothetical protein
LINKAAREKMFTERERRFSDTRRDWDVAKNVLDNITDYLNLNEKSVEKAPCRTISKLQ